MEEPLILLGTDETYVYVVLYPSVSFFFGLRIWEMSIKRDLRMDNQPVGCWHSREGELYPKKLSLPRTFLLDLAGIV